MLRILTFVISIALSNSTLAAKLEIVSDIPPVGALVSKIAGKRAVTNVLLAKNASAHHAALRPSDSRALSEADIVFYVSPILTPWLEKPLVNLAGNATRIALLDQTKDLALPLRDKGGHDDHDHGEGPDPHAWLSPKVALAWAEIISEHLSNAAPEHADHFAQNLAEFQTEIGTLNDDLGARLNSDLNFLMLHDAAQYFEAAFNLHPKALFFDTGEAAFGAGDLKTLQKLVQDESIDCVMIDAAHPQSAAQTILTRAGVKVLSIDVMGHGLGYTELLGSIADQFVACGGLDEM